MRRYWISAVVAAAVVSGGQALAHHSGAMFDMTKIVTISGTVQQFNWTNPHSSFKVLVANATGTEDVWAVEMGGPNNLIREGWKRTTLKPGDKVTVTVRPLRDGVPGGAYVGIVLADGTSLGGEPKQ
jgi:Family of unknown function (DUF6152)